MRTSSRTIAVAFLFTSALAGFAQAETVNRGDYYEGVDRMPQHLDTMTTGSVSKTTDGRSQVSGGDGQYYEGIAR